MYSRSACRNEPSPKKIRRFRHSSFIERTKRSAKAFKFGDRGGSRMISIPWRSSNARKVGVYLAARAMAGGRGARGGPAAGAGGGRPGGGGGAAAGGAGM